MEPDNAHAASIISEREWARAVDSLPAYGSRMEDLVKSLLDESKISPHTVTHRVKKRENAVRKIERKTRSDYSLADITDLLGLRVITYFDYEVDTIAQIIEREFDVDHERSVDKRTVLDPDRFGYLSLHYIVRLTPNRLRLVEYRQFKDIPFEIQIRSILQHAWAEIEHDLGYKSQQAIPAPLRRRFSRLAGLLELADEEFAAIRAELGRYENQVQVAVRDNELEEAINRDSIAAYITGSARLKELENLLAAALTNERSDNVTSAYAEARANELLAVGLTSLGDIDRALERDGGYLWRFVRNWFTRPERSGALRRRRTLNGGVLLLYLAVVRALELPDADAESLLNQFGLAATSISRLIEERDKARVEDARD